MISDREPTAGMPPPAARMTAIWSDLLSTAGVAVAVVDGPGRVLLANRALRDACGWAPEGAGVHTWRDCMSGDADATEAFAAWLAGGPPHGPMEVRLPDGGCDPGRWLRWYREPQRDGAGVITSIALVGFDVSRERHDEAKLLRATRLYRALADMNTAMGRVPDATSLFQAVCDIAVASGGALMAWVGIAREGELEPVAWGGRARDYTAGLRLSVSADGSGPHGPSAQAFATGEPAICNDVEMDPRMRPWLARARAFGLRASAAFPIVRQGNRMGVLNLYFAECGAFDAPAVDLAQRMVGDVEFALDRLDREHARAEAERVARERELQLAGLVESALDAIIAIDAGHRVVLFNTAASRMFGVAAGDAIGGTLDRFIPAGAREAHRGFVQRYASEGRSSRTMGAIGGLVGLRASGEVFPIDASISRSGEGERLLMTVMVRDMTQLRQAQGEQIARLQAEAASRAKTDFLSRISHELRTPLNAILGFSQLLQADVRDPLSSRQREQVELVVQAGGHLGALIEEMLDLASIEAGRTVVVARDFELRELLDGVLRMSAPHAAECGVRLEALYAPGETLWMRSDPSRIRQIVLNLVSNGIKYNRRGGAVQVDMARQAEGVIVRVRDDGLGMTVAQLAQLYQPFNRLGREGGTTPGMGIGLVLVRQLARLLGGDIAIESADRVGTTVRVMLPDVAAPRPSAGVAASEPAIDGDEPTGCVLYVEDNEVNALLVVQMLARWPGVRVVIAADGSAGLAQARALVPDVILLDMQLPGLTGIEVLRTLRQEPALASTPIVALSASAMPAEVQAARAAGAADYWTKPVALATFLEKMRQLLRGPR